MDESIMEALGLLPRRGPGAGALGGGDPRIARIAGLLGPLPGIQQSQMGGLMGGGPMPPAQQPQMQEPASMAPAPQSLWERMQSGLMPSPAGMGGLLSPDEIGSARGRGLLDFGLSMLANSQGQNGGNAPSLGQALQQGVGALRQGYDQGVDTTLKGKLTGMQLQQQMAMMKAKQALTAKMQQAFPNFSQMTPQQQHQAVTSIFGEALANGLWDEAGKIASVLPSMQPGKATKYELPFKDVDRGGKIERHYPDGRVEMVDKYPSAKDPNAPDHAAELSQQREFQREQGRYNREQQLADDYNKDTKETRDMATRVTGALSEAPAAKAGDGVAQVNMLYAFVSSMDPGTAVREGEIGLVRSAGSLIQQAQGLLAKYGQGQAVTVPPAMVDQIANLMRRRLDGSAKYVKSRSQYYKGRAKRWGINEDAFPELDIPQSTQTPPAGSNPLLR